MLSAADEILVARNPEIPGLRTLLDPARMSELLRGNSSTLIDQCQIQPRYIRFKPTSSCLVAYDCRLGGQVHQFYAKGHSTENASKVDKAARRPAKEGPIGPGRIIDRDDLISVSFFPNDIALGGLSHYLDKAPHVRVLAYKPERRFVGLVRPPGHSPEVVKIYKSSAFAKAVSLAEAAGNIPFMPQLRSVDEEHQALRLGWVPGTTLTEQIRTNQGFLRTAHAAGVALARLHQLSPPPGLVQCSPDADCQRIMVITRGLRNLTPELGDIAEDIGRDIGALSAGAVTEPTLVHGDFYSNQIIANANGISILDFDELGIGLPEADLGLFIAHLEYDVVRDRLAPHQVAHIAATLMAGYRGARPFDPWAVFAQTLHGMFQLAHRPFRDGMTDWPTVTRCWLERIEQLLRHPPDWVQVQVVPRHPTFCDTARQAPLIPALATALDPDVGARLVEQSLAESGLQISEPVMDHCRLLRHKPGRRALIEYQLIDRNSQATARVLGKIRVKGSDEKTFRLNRAIHGLTSGFGSRQLLRVPKALAVVPELGMWLQEFVDGQDGWSALASRQAVQAAADIAQALFELHNMPLSTSRQHGTADELAILEQRLEKLAELTPRLRNRVGSLLLDCQAICLQIGQRPVCGVHRDFYPDQVILKDERVFFLDLDLYAIGDPALDLGNFVAHVQETDLRLLGNPNARREVTDAFLAAYYALSKDPRLPRAVAIYRLLSLARLVQISTQFPDRQPYMLRELEFCEREFNALLDHNSQKISSN